MEAAISGGRSRGGVLRGARGRGGLSFKSSMFGNSYQAESEDSSTIIASTDETMTDLAKMSLTRHEEKKKIPYLSSPDQMITFIVGELQRKFIIHMEFACKHSEVLKAAFDGPFIERKTGVYNLEDVNPETFRLFAEYLYSGKTTLLHHNVDPTDDHGNADNHTAECVDQDLTLEQLWVLADRFLVRTLQNQVVIHMERIRQSCGEMRPGCWGYVYDNTTLGSPLRALVAEKCAWSNSVGCDDLQQAPQELLKDMVQAYRKALPDRVRQKNSDTIQSLDYFIF